MTRAEDLVKSELALAAWRYGAIYGGHNASLLVAQVFATRQKRGWGAWLDVIERAPKFDAAPPKTSGYPNLWDKSFLRILSEVDPIFEGTKKDDTNGALYFGDTTDIQSKWFLMKIARNPEEHQIVASMNTLTFWN